MTDAPPTLADAELLAAIPAAAATLRATAEVAGLEAPVPSCPGWTVTDLVTHTGGVHRWATAVLEAAGGPPPSEREAPPAGGDVLAWFDEGAGRLVERLGALGPSAPAWNFARQPPTAAFWIRRQAHETAMHAVDAQLAAGHVPAMDPALASDGIDELLLTITPRALRRAAAEGRPALATALGSLHVHCTDVDGEWLVHGGDGWDGLAVTREHAKGDAALRGRALDLLLRLSNRGSGGEVVGDGAVLDRWAEAVRF